MEDSSSDEGGLNNLLMQLVNADPVAQATYLKLQIQMMISEENFRATQENPVEFLSACEKLTSLSRTNGFPIDDIVEPRLLILSGHLNKKLTQEKAVLDVQTKQFLQIFNSDVKKFESISSDSGKILTFQKWAFIFKTLTDRMEGRFVIVLDEQDEKQTRVWKSIQEDVSTNKAPEKPSTGFRYKPTENRNVPMPKQVVYGTTEDRNKFFSEEPKRSSYNNSSLEAKKNLDKDGSLGKTSSDANRCCCSIL